MELFQNYLVSVLSAIFAMANGAVFNVNDLESSRLRDVASEIREFLSDDFCSNADRTSEGHQNLLLARQAYIWGWPLVYMQNCKRSLSILNGPGVSGGSPVAPPNQLSMLHDFIAPASFTIPCPNQDVVYGFGLLDLRKTSVVLQVPDFGTRFWLFQLGDHRTDSFAQIGSMYKTRPGHYLIVGPSWDGNVPEGIQGILHCPTNIGFCLPRIYMDGSDEDRRVVQKLIQRIQIYPESKYTGKWKTRDWTKTKWYPMVAAGNRLRSKWVNPDTFFEVLEETLKEVPPLPNEVDFYDRVMKLIDESKTNAELRRLLSEVARATERDYVRPLFDFQQNGIEVGNGWRSFENGAAFGSDYITRTAIARSNIFVNRHSEAKYFYLTIGNDGRRLEGSRKYTLLFPEGNLPPAKGFWSLTLYDKDHRLFLNSEQRYAVGTRTKDLITNNDGSVSIYVQAEPPSQALRNNWLPAPEGRYSLYLRVYWPAESALSGEWLPPTAVLVDELATQDLKSVQDEAIR